MMNNLATTLSHERRFADAEQMLREVLEIRRRVLGRNNPDTLQAMANLAVTIAHERRYAEAEQLLHESHDGQRQVLRPQNPATASSTYDLAVVAALQGNRDDALSLLRGAVDHGLSPRGVADIERDPDLDTLHGDPHFEPLVAYVTHHTVAARSTL